MATRDAFEIGDFVWLTLQKTWGKITYRMQTEAEVFVKGLHEKVPYTCMELIFNPLRVGDKVLFEGKEYEVKELTAPYFVTGMTQVRLWSPETFRTVWTTYTQVERIVEIVAVDKQKQLEDYCDSIYDQDNLMDKQVGGDHYTRFTIQPLEFIRKNNLDFLQGNIIKYVVRYKSKNGIEDLEKAKDYLEKLIAYEKNV